jgi:hypothetical protein
MRMRRAAVLDELETLAAQAGYAVKRTQESYAMAHLIVRYENAAGSPDAIKLDVNFLDRVPVVEPVVLPLRHPFGDDLPATDVTTFALAELAASKLVALARRSLARDLFDVAQLARVPALQVASVRTLLVVRGAAYPPPTPEQYSPQAGARIRLIDWRAQVMALLQRDQRADLADARMAAGTLLGEVLALEERHLDFLRALEGGRLDPGILAEPALVERVRVNPGLLWRLQRGAGTLEER